MNIGNDEVGKVAGREFYFIAMGTLGRQVAKEIRYDVHLRVRLSGLTA